jgi:hypothetical protein
LQIVREDKATLAADQPEPSDTTHHPATDDATDGAADSKLQKPKRSGTAKLAAPTGAKRTRSHSRHSTVTDRGQTNISLEDLSKLAPAGTGIAPERTESSALRGETSNTFSPPGVVVSDHPLSPDTLIPATDGLSTRPTKGGIAYPFSLKVDGAERQDVNASMLTLQSLNVTTPPAVDAEQKEKELGGLSAVTSLQFDVAGPSVGQSTFLAYAPADSFAALPSTEPAQAEQTSPDASAEIARPGVQRYYTGAPGAGLFSDGVQSNDAEKVARPPVERFETAQEDLNTLAANNERV